MLSLGAPFTKDEIVAGLKAEHQVVHEFFTAIPLDDFFVAPDGVWSPAENLVHLCQSSEPLLLAFKLPRLALRARFGKPDHRSVSLAAIRTQYTQVALAGGGEASGAYLPQIDAPTAEARTEILARWLETGGKLETAVGSKSDQDLEKAAVRHPLLGQHTLREILLFTLYHNLHHVRDVQTLLGQPLWEWFNPVLTE